MGKRGGNHSGAVAGVRRAHDYAVRVSEKPTFFTGFTPRNSEKGPLGGKNFRGKCFSGPTFESLGIDPMKAFLLPCACSQSIVITSGQAGGTVSCPGCGRDVAVPKLRDFDRLEPAAGGQSRQRESWRLSHACMLAGGLTAVLAWGVAIVFAMPMRSPFTADTIRAGVAAASDSQIYAAWKSLSRSGIARPPLPDEKRIQQTVSFRTGLARGLFVIGGLGAAVGLLGVALRAGGRKAEA